MEQFRCKMCGGTLSINYETMTAVCDYCGSEQALPNLDNDDLSQTYERAESLRRRNEFDEAKTIYNMLIAQKQDDPDLYWCQVLCRYGIEYIEDPLSGQRKPTLHRIQYANVLDDINYQTAIKYANDEQRQIYESCAAQLEKIRIESLKLTANEDPYDVFICYKETDMDGYTTTDSEIGNDIYKSLTGEGYKVFFSKITLQNKLGTQFEPYIFSALNSAKIMLVIGTEPEYVESIWVKNEWSRYLELLKEDSSRSLALCYMSEDKLADYPKPLLSASKFDLSQPGYLPELIRLVKKVVGEIKKEEDISARDLSNAILRRAKDEMDDGNSKEAIRLCYQALDTDPENADINYYRYLYNNGYKNTEEVIQSIRKKLDPVPRDADFNTARQSASARTKDDIADIIHVEGEEIFNYGDKLFKNNNFEEAEKVFSKIFNNEEKQDEAMAGAAVCKMKINHHIELVRIFDGLFEKYSREADFLKTIRTTTAEATYKYKRKRVNRVLAFFVLVNTILSILAYIGLFGYAILETEPMYFFAFFIGGVVFIPIMIVWMVLRYRVHDAATVVMGIATVLLNPFMVFKVLYDAVTIIRDEELTSKKLSALAHDINLQNEQIRETEANHEALGNEMNNAAQELKAFKVTKPTVKSKYIKNYQPV